MTLRQFTHCIDGYVERLEDYTKGEDALNHALGKYVGFAMNDPKKYPDKPFSQQDRSDSSGLMTTDEALEAYISAKAEAQDTEN